MRIPIDTVLLLVDLQNAIHDACWGRRNNPDAEDWAAALLAVWRDCRMPVVHVRHDSVEPRSPYRPGGPGHPFLDGLEPAPGEAVIGKQTGSAFVGTGLEDLLAAGGHTTLVVCGVLTHNSVATTVRHAGCLGFRVFVASDACWAVEQTDSTGKVWPAEAVHRLALAGLHGEYATIVEARMACEAAALIASRRK